MSESIIHAQLESALAAYRANDLAAYFGAVAGDATILVGGVGRVSKQVYHDKWSGVIASGGGVAALAIDDLQIRVSEQGDAGVATFVMKVDYKGLVAQAPDQLLSKTLASTEVWFKAGSRWQIAHLGWFEIPQAA